MHRLWPTDHTSEPAEAADRRLEEFYAFPPNLRRPWLRVNFVTSLDGAVTLQGRSRGLSTPADQQVLQLIRDLSDVVLVGIGTALVEGYHGLHATELRADRRRRHNLSPVPPIALVTRLCSLSPDSPLVTDTTVPPIVLTCAAAPEERRAALVDVGVDVVVVGDEEVDLVRAVDALDQRGLRRIGCEGGPTLFGALLAADLVDELCLTMSPLLTAGDAGRISTGACMPEPRRMRLVSALHAEDSLLLLRYQRHDNGGVTH